MEQLLNKYLIKNDNYVKYENEMQKWFDSITNKNNWEIIINSLNNKETNLKSYFQSLNDESREKYFKFGIASLLLFIQTNFTGPEIDENTKKFFDGNPLFTKTDFNKFLSKSNEIEVSTNVKYPILLINSEIIFDNCIIDDELINKWWSFRANKVHQQILDELSFELFEKVEEFYKLIETNQFELEDLIKAKLNIELAQFYLIYKHISKVKKMIGNSVDILGIEMELKGKLGKRTKYQEESIAQLMLEVKLIEKNGIKRPVISENNLMPKNLCLNDDIRLDQIEFKESTDLVELPNIEQQLLLSIVQEKLASTPSDELQGEEIQPFLNLILNQSNTTYPVRVAALLLRCKLENKNKRTIERCLKQCEEILDYFQRNEPKNLIRIGWSFFGTNLPPIWQVEQQLANILLNLGLVQQSLDTFLKLKLWEEVIVCYTILKRRHKAAEIIQQQIEIKPTIKLFCLLGDATDDVSCYEKAWEMSNERSYRAQRHWGQYLFEHKNYSECIPHYQQSLNINPLQSDLWFRLGFVGLQTENWEISANSYKRYTYLEPESFEAWNNLAQAYIKLNLKRNAHFALLEALKYNFESWKVWENLLIVSCDILHFSDIIRSYHRVLDLKEKYLNIHALSHLVTSICKNCNDFEGQPPSAKLIKRTQELLGRVTSIFSNEGYLWELYSNLVVNKPSIRLQYLQKSYKSYAITGWDKNPELCLQVLYICSRMSDIVLTEEVKDRNVVNSIRLNVNSALSAVRKQDWNETKTLSEEIGSQYQKIVEKLTTLNSS